MTYDADAAHRKPATGQRPPESAERPAFDRLPLMNGFMRVMVWLLGWLIPFVVVCVIFIGLFWLAALVLSLGSSKSVSEVFMALLNSLLWN